MLHDALPENSSAGQRKIRTFEDLQVWMFCRELRNELTSLAQNLPRLETYRLADQIIRAARSVTNNIAEGYGRFHYQENIQFCRQSRGSVYEIIDHLTIGMDSNYITESQFDVLRDRCLRGIRLLNGYIRYLTKRKAEKANND